jgi:hypothetical protein
MIEKQRAAIRVALEVVSPPRDGAGFRTKRPRFARPAGGAARLVRRNAGGATRRESAKRGQPKQFCQETLSRQFHVYE